MSFLEHLAVEQSCEQFCGCPKKLQNLDKLIQLSSEGPILGGFGLEIQVNGYILFYFLVLRICTTGVSF